VHVLFRILLTVGYVWQGKGRGPACSNDKGEGVDNNSKGTLLQLSIACPTNPPNGKGWGIRQGGESNSPTPWAAVDHNFPTGYGVYNSSKSGMNCLQGTDISLPIAPPLPVMGQTIDSCIKLRWCLN
jgi:hypothetical protein